MRKKDEREVGDGGERQVNGGGEEVGGGGGTTKDRRQTGKKEKTYNDREKED